MVCWNAGSIWIIKRQVRQHHSSSPTRWKSALHHQYRCKHKSHWRSVNAMWLRREYEYSIHRFPSVNPDGTALYYMWARITRNHFCIGKVQFIYGYKILLYTDNKSLTFLNRCAITSNRVARWMLSLQQYDIELRHVKGTQNHLADVISRNPAGLSANEIQNLTKPNTIMMNKINLDIDRSVCKDLRKLIELQMTDPSIQGIRKRIVQQPMVTNPRYQIINDAVFYREGRYTHEWKPVLPACLEESVLQYAHTSLGHLGVKSACSKLNRHITLRIWVTRCANL